MPKPILYTRKERCGKQIHKTHTLYDIQEDKTHTLYDIQEDTHPKLASTASLSVGFRARGFAVKGLGFRVDGLGV